MNLLAGVDVHGSHWNHVEKDHGNNQTNDLDRQVNDGGSPQEVIAP